jgi:chromosome partitioning protein
VPPALRPRCYGIWIRKAQQLISCDAKPLSELPSKKIISGKRELPELIIPTGYEKFDVLPADFSYRNFDLHLSERKRPTERLLKMSRSLRELYEFLVLDCPPGISLLSENVLRAADAVIVPLLPTPLSVRMLMQLRDFVAASEWGDLKLLPFFFMVDRRKALHLEVIAATRREFPEILSTEIPYWSDIERMSERRAPLCAYAPHSPAGLIYASLWREIQTRMTEALAPSQLVLHAGQGHRSTQAGALEVIESTTNSTLGMS